ncbi:Uncharacterized protein FWK35_00027422, partial [Aphis craccivora]
KLVLRKNSRFPLIFFWFFPALLKTIRNQKKTYLMHQLDSFCYWKPPPKFEIEALFRHVLLYTDTQKKKNTHNIVKAIHSSLRSESKSVVK